MPVNRNALIRYKTIDNCLRNRYRKWTLDNLIQACSEALYDYEGIEKGVSRRTVQMDIQLMRSDKLGYHAPIIVNEKKYYTYDSPDYSITNIPLTQQDLGKLSEVVDILRQFKGFTHFQELSGMVQKLEDKIHTSKTHGHPVIDIEKNENLKGLDFIDPLFQAITAKKCVNITYKSFKARKEDNFIFHPALLKEFRNRWFVLGKKKPDNPFLMLALDRIIALEVSEALLTNFEQQKITNYFSDVIGVSVNEGEAPQEVLLFIDHSNAPYVLTKPIHHSQSLVEKNDQGIVIRLLVQVNFELEREILGFGDSIKVLSPIRLRSRIKDKLLHAIDLYNTDFNDSRAKVFNDKLVSKGYAIANHIYTRRDVRKMIRTIHHYISETPPSIEPVIAIRNLLNEIPVLKQLLINNNLIKMLSSFGTGFFLSKAIFFDKSAQSNWYVTWHQDTIINVKEKIETEGYSAWTVKDKMHGVCPPENILKNTIAIRIHLDDTNADNGALKVIAGSHKKKLKDSEINLITQSSVPTVCEVQSGGVQLMKPLLIHSSSKTINNKNRSVIHLEFNSVELANGLEWAERLNIG